MSIKSRIFAGAASFVALGGAGTTGMLAAGAASAATPSCGHSCIDLFSEKFGKNFVLDSIGQGTRTGTKGILFQASNSDPAEDWTVSIQGDVDNPSSGVGDLATEDPGLLSPAVNVHYGQDYAVELEYTPLGVDSGECLGTATVARNGTRVSLQPCGQTSKTIWIIDNQNVQSYHWQHYVPLINGSDTNFSHPYVLHYPGGTPTDRPRPQLTTYTLQVDSRGVVSDDEEWGVKFGVLK